MTGPKLTSIPNPLVQNSNTVAAPAVQTGAVLQAVGADSAVVRIEIDAYAAQGFFTVIRRNGTAASPSQTLAGEQIGGFNGMGYTSSAAVSNPISSFRTYALESLTASAQGGIATIAVNASGGTTLTDVLSVYGTTGVGIGLASATTAPTAKLEVSGTFKATSAALNGATIGSNALAVTGPSQFNGPINVNVGAFTSTVSSDINSLGAAGTGAITVTSTSGLTTGTTYTFWVDSEAITASVTDGTHLNVTARALYGTTGASHANTTASLYVVSYISAPSTSVAPSFVVLSTGRIALGGGFSTANAATLYLGSGFRVTTGNAVITNTIAAQSLGSTFPDITFGSGAILTGPSAAVLHLGAADAASPIAQTLGVQGVVAGTTDTAGPDWTLSSAVSTGTKDGGGYIFTGTPGGSTGSTVNTTVSARLQVDAANALSLRNGSNAQTFSVYNTADAIGTKLTNYDRVSLFYTSNLAILRSLSAGSGTTRPLYIGTASTNLVSNESTATANGFWQFQRSQAVAAANAIGVDFFFAGSNTWTASSGSNAAINVGPTVNQSSTAGLDVIRMSPVVTAKGSGGLNLLHGLAGASGTTEVFSITDAGLFTTIGGVTVGSGQALKLGNAATTGLGAGVVAALTNATIVITDSTGQAYRIPCII